VDHRSAGEWCIKPNFSVNVGTVVPVVSVDQSRSTGAIAAMVQYRSNNTGCPGAIPVSAIQQDLNPGSPTRGLFLPSDNIAFTIVVP
jgi:hypothetical protein